MPPIQKREPLESGSHASPLPASLSSQVRAANATNRKSLGHGALSGAVVDIRVPPFPQAALIHARGVFTGRTGAPRRPPARPCNRGGKDCRKPHSDIPEPPCPRTNRRPATVTPCTRAAGIGPRGCERADRKAIPRHCPARLHSQPAGWPFLPGRTA